MDVPRKRKNKMLGLGVPRRNGLTTSI